MNDISFVNCFVNGAGTEEDIAANYSKQYGFDVYAIALYSNYYIGNTWGAGGNGVTAKCENPEEAVRLIELMTTEEGVELYNMIVYGLEGKHYEIPMIDVFYIEAVDNTVFIYGSKSVYETKQKLYELEELLREKHFLRVSKSLIINLMKVKAIRPALNGRYTAILNNNEEVIISRKYVTALKNTLKGDS